MPRYDFCRSRIICIRDLQHTRQKNKYQTWNSVDIRKSMSACDWIPIAFLLATISRAAQLKTAHTCVFTQVHLIHTHSRHCDDLHAIALLNNFKLPGARRLFNCASACNDINQARSFIPLLYVIKLYNTTKKKSRFVVGYMCFSRSWPSPGV